MGKLKKIQIMNFFFGGGQGLSQVGVGKIFYSHTLLVWSRCTTFTQKLNLKTCLHEGWITSTGDRVLAFQCG